jgi:signal transduction histidine kinase
MEQIDLADSMLNLAEQNAMTFKSDRGLIRVYQLRAELFLREDQPQSALALAIKATNMATASQVKELVYITHRTLSNCYAALGEFQLAHQHRTRSDAYQDSVLYLTSQNEIELMSYVNRRVHLETLSQRNILIQRITEQQRYLIWGLSMVVCMVSVLLFVLFQNRRAISVQKRELEKLNAFKTQLFSIVAHDLRSPVLSIAAVLEALNSKLATKEDIAPLLPEMQRKVVGLQKLFSDLLDWGRLQMKNSQLTYDTIDMDELITNVSKEFAENLEQKRIKLLSHLDIHEVRSNREMLHIAIRNLVSNAIKFSHPDSNIILRAFREKQNIRIDVQDAGIGLSKSAITKLLSGKAQSQTGTIGEVGSGLGMAICIDFIHRLGGQLVIDSKEGSGTTFSILLPC